MNCTHLIVKWGKFINIWTCNALCSQYTAQSPNCVCNNWRRTIEGNYQNSNISSSEMFIKRNTLYFVTPTDPDYWCLSYSKLQKGIRNSVLLICWPMHLKINWMSFFRLRLPTQWNPADVFWIGQLISNVETIHQNIYAYGHVWFKCGGKKRKLFRKSQLCIAKDV